MIVSLVIELLVTELSREDVHMFVLIFGVQGPAVPVQEKCSDKQVARDHEWSSMIALSGYFCLVGQTKAKNV